MRALLASALVALALSPGFAGAIENPLDPHLDQALDPLLDPETKARTLAKVGGGLPVAAYFVVDSQAELNATWRLHVGGDAPLIEFAAEVVLVAMSGVRSYFCGFGIREVERTADNRTVAGTRGLVVSVADALVPPNSICLPVVSRSMHVVAVPRAPGAVVFADAVTHAPVAADFVRVATTDVVLPSLRAATSEHLSPIAR